MKKWRKKFLRNFKSILKRAKSLPLEGKVAEAEQRSAKTDEVDKIRRNALGVSTTTIHYSLSTIH